MQDPSNLARRSDSRPLSEEIWRFCAETMRTDPDVFLFAPAARISGTRIWPRARTQFIDSGYQETVQHFDMTGSDLEAVLRYTRPADINGARQDLALVLIYGEKHDKVFHLPCVEVHNFGTVGKDFSPSLKRLVLPAEPRSLAIWKRYTARAVEELAGILEDDVRVTSFSAVIDQNGCKTPYIYTTQNDDRDSLEAEFQHFKGIRVEIKLLSQSFAELLDPEDRLIGVHEAASRLNQLIRQNRLRINLLVDAKQGIISAQSANLKDLFLLQRMIPERHAYGWPVEISCPSGSAIVEPPRPAGID